jgi:hypothetical protein
MVMASRRRIVSEELDDDASGAHTFYSLAGFMMTKRGQADVNMSLESEEGEELDVDIETSGGTQNRLSRMQDDDAEMEDEDDEEEHEGVRSFGAQLSFVQ